MHEQCGIVAKEIYLNLNCMDQIWCSGGESRVLWMLKVVSFQLII